MIGKVLTFDENRGWGMVRLSDGRVIKVTHREIEGEGFVLLFEGEEVEVELDEGNSVKRVLRIDRDAPFRGH